MGDRFGLAASILFAVAALGDQGEAAARRPNILWICADDLSCQMIGAYGAKGVATPNIDRLANQGARFDRAYCNSPVCTASRGSFLTGRYPRSVGVTLLKTPLPERETTLAELLVAEGYTTAAFGKMHFNSKLKHGFEARLDLEDHAAWLRGRQLSPLPPGLEVQPKWRPFVDPARVWLNAAAKPIGRHDAEMASSWLVDNAAKFLSTPREKPFFLMFSFYEPHSPFWFPVEDAGRHRADEYPSPAPLPRDLREVPKIFRDLTDQDKRGIVAAYATSVEFLDRSIGRLLDALEKSPAAKNTVVALIGDHGYMLGQHGRFEKHCFYEPAVRAPLLIRLPGHKANPTTTALVEFVDLAPTLLELAGARVPRDMQGRSLGPLLNGGASRHREWVISEYAENEEAMIRDERFKLVYCTGKRERQDGYTTGESLKRRQIRLFDLQADPQETVDLAGRPEHADRVRLMLGRLADHVRRTAPDSAGLPTTDDAMVLLDAGLAPQDAAVP